MVVCRLSCSAACGILFSNQGLNLILCIVTCVCVYVCAHVCTCVHMQARALSCLTLCDPKDCCPPGFSVHGDSPGKNTGMGCHFLLQGIFATHRSNLASCTGRQILYKCTTWEALIKSLPLTNLLLPKRNPVNVLNGRPLGSLSW